MFQSSDKIDIPYLIISCAIEPFVVLFVSEIFAKFVVY